ncbi:MAG: InlB B-repeat-containing protein [Clostridia bacterium]|nr:InlB B-repeat-containing protein [Clostridia bacterium]
MKRLIALLVAVIMAVAFIPVTAAPVGTDISGTRCAYLTSGGGSSSTNFLTSADFASHKLTVINCWDSNCGPCTSEMPYFQSLHNNYSSKGVLVVGVCTTYIGGSYAAEWNLIQNNGYTYTFVKQDTVMYNLYSPQGYLPQTFLVNSAGKVVEFIGGGTTYSNLASRADYWLSQAQDPEVYYDVTFKDGLTGSTIQTVSVLSGNKPTYPTPPTHTGYTFTGWTPSTPPTITAPTTITANYSASAYTVTFVDGLTGSVITTQNVAYGSKPTYPTPPTHDGYTFTGWSPSTPPVITGPTTITAYYSTVVSYLVTFVDGLTGSTITTQTVAHGSTPTYPTPPTHEGYDFVGWTPSTPPVITGPTTITANYSGNSYPVTFVDGVTGNTIMVVNVATGNTPVYPTSIPTHEGYTFISWSPSTPPVITSPTTITAVYRAARHRVRFIDSISGLVIASRYVEHGRDAEPPMPYEYDGYTFIGWDRGFTSVTEAIDVYTIYQKDEVAQTLPGDIDGDGRVGFTDVTIMYSYLLNNGNNSITEQGLANADTNRDGSLSIADIALIYGIILG